MPLNKDSYVKKKGTKFIHRHEKQSPTVITNTEFKSFLTTM